MRLFIPVFILCVLNISYAATMRLYNATPIALHVSYSRTNQIKRATHEQIDLPSWTYQDITVSIPAGKTVEFMMTRAWSDSGAHDWGLCGVYFKHPSDYSEIHLNLENHKQIVCRGL